MPRSASHPLRSLAAVAALGAALLALPSAAEARTFFSFGFGFPGFYAGPPAFYYPPPVYLPPPPPVFYAPPPAVYAPPPEPGYAPSTSAGRCYAGAYVCPRTGWVRSALPALVRPTPDALGAGSAKRPDSADALTVPSDSG